RGSLSRLCQPALPMPRFMVLAQSLLCLFDVALELLHEVRRAAEGTRVTQPVDEVDRQELANQLSREADQVNLNLASLLAKGGVGTDIGCAWPGLLTQESPRGINAVARRQRLQLLQIGGWKTKRPPPFPACANR